MLAPFQELSSRPWVVTAFPSSQQVLWHSTDLEKHGILGYTSWNQVLVLADICYVKWVIWPASPSLLPHREIGTNDNITYHVRQLRSNKIMHVTLL